MSGREGAARTNWTAWVRKAESDGLNIRNNLSASHVPWDTVCFHAQQRAEKLLKAFLLFHGQTARHTHDLVVLLSDCARFEKSLSLLEGDCQTLTAFAVQSRYPDDMFEIGEQDGRTVVACSERVGARILELLPTP
jgi:HEPN domain-containing protein